MSVTVYACVLKKYGLPTDGLSWNGPAINDRLGAIKYMENLNEDQKLDFLDLILSLAYDDGFASCERLEEV